MEWIAPTIRTAWKDIQAAMHDKEGEIPSQRSSPAGYVAPEVNGLKLSQMVPGIDPASGHVSVRRSSLQFRAHRGPLPAAEDLQKYADIDPKVLDVILSMAQQNNETQNVTRRREQLFTFLGDLSKTFVGLVIIGACVVAAYGLAMHDHPYIASVLGTTTLLIGISVVVMRVVPKTAAISGKQAPNGAPDPVHDK